MQAKFCLCPGAETGPEDSLSCLSPDLSVPPPAPHRSGRRGRETPAPGPPARSPPCRRRRDRSPAEGRTARGRRGRPGDPVWSDPPQRRRRRRPYRAGTPEIRRTRRRPFSSSWTGSRRQSRLFKLGARKLGFFKAEMNAQCICIR